MDKIQVRSFREPDETLTPPLGTSAIVRIGELTVERGVLQPGWSWRQHVKPIVRTESCRFHHRGIVLSGQLGIRMDDGEQAIIGPAGIVDAIEINDAGIDKSAQFKQMMPITTVAGKPRRVEAYDRTDFASAEPCDQAVESGPRHRSACRSPEIVIDDFHVDESTLAGNLTILGSVANLIVVEAAREERLTIGFWEYARIGVPITGVTLAVGWALLVLVQT